MKKMKKKIKIKTCTYKIEKKSSSYNQPIRDGIGSGGGKQRASQMRERKKRKELFKKCRERRCCGVL